jgi:3-oxoadipate enol-lactonase
MPCIELSGISLYYEDAGSDGPPVLLLHELDGSSESWRRIMPLIAPHRRVIAPDLRCAGRSEKPPRPFGMLDLADEVAELVRRLRLEQVDVIGAALGAMLAAMMSVRHPDLVRRMVLCGVTDAIDQRTRDYLIQRADHVREIGMRGVADASLGNAFPDPHAMARAEYRPIYLANDPAAYAQLSIALAGLDTTPALWRGIACPTLVISGRHDFIWPPDAGRRVAGYVPGAEFTELADAGHFPHMHTPQALTDAALTFLSRTSP